MQGNRREQSGERRAGCRWKPSLLYPLFSLLTSSLFLACGLHAQLGLRDPAFIAATAPSGCAACPPVTDYSMWIDPSDQSTLWTNSARTAQAQPNDFVRRVDDKSASGTNYLMIESNGEAPRYTTTNMFPTGIAGLKSGQMITSNATSLGTTSVSTSSVTMFIVGKPKFVTFIFQMILTWGPPITHGLELREVNGGPNMEFITPNGVVNGGSTYTNGQTYAWCIQMAAPSAPGGSTVRMWTGLTRHTDSTTADNFPPYATSKIGYGKLLNFSANFEWLGDYGEMIAYPRLLSGSEVTNVQNYLITKWGARNVWP